MNIKKILIIYLVWFVIINCFALLVLNRFNLNGDNAYSWINHNEFKQNQSWGLIKLHARWDSQWYLDIAENGYEFKGPGKLTNVAFFPLYPILIKLFSLFLGNNLILAGWLISTEALYFGLIFLYRLVKEFHPKTDPRLSILLLLIFPTSFFLNAVYSEALFLFFSVAVIYYSLKKNFLYAGLFGLLSALTRSAGLFLFIPVLWEYLSVSNFKISKIFNLKALPILLIPMGTFSLFLYYLIKFNNFFLYIEAHKLWGRIYKFNREHFQIFSNPSIVNLVLDILFLVFILVGTYFVFKKLRVSYGLYMATTIAVLLSSGTLMSIGRFILVLFPVYILGGSIKNKFVQQVWLIVSTLLLGMNITLFVNNYWAG